MINRFRYRKITPEILEKMKKLRENGLTYYEIARKFNIAYSTAQYWLTKGEREKKSKRAMKYNKKITKKEFRIKNKKYSEWRKEYMNDRYHNDEKFRKRFIELAQKSFKNRREKWILKGLCSQCGRKRKDKSFLMCEICRDKGRENYYQNKEKEKK